jgi:hypothetical protein
MNFGLVTLAMALTITAFCVAKAHDEIIANTPATRGIVAAAHNSKRHHPRTEDHQIASSSTTTDIGTPDTAIDQRMLMSAAH